MRRVSHYEHAFRAGRGEPVERVPHPDYQHPDADPPAAALVDAPPILGDLIVDQVTAAQETVDQGAESTEGVDAGVDAVTSEAPAETSQAADLEIVPAAATASTEPLDPAPLALTFTSSNIRSATLDPGTGIVDVTFTSDKTYRYAAFTVELMVEWRAAKSAGRWFNANIKTRPDLHPLIAPSPPAAG